MAYVNATLVSVTPQTDGSVALVILCTGNAGESDRTITGLRVNRLEPYTLDDLRRERDAHLLRLNTSLQASATLVPGPIVGSVTPDDPDTVAFMLFIDRYRRLVNATRAVSAPIAIVSAQVASDILTLRGQCEAALEAVTAVQRQRLLRGMTVIG